ncbi:MAG: polyprenyl synthetase family protein [Sphingobacterium sp.]|uniref:polyprenyl synthetase family protein n=1 Tax=Sphingobacterium sp. JB170 TaxID=1434842 RepID=UPI000B361EA3|nr:polyprenyl synthetase family protein [Sphingobacterium sp. JB170]
MFQNLTHAKVFQEFLQQTTFPDQPSNLYEPVRYMLSLSGKRIRPLLVLMGAELFDSEKIETALPASLAIELFHNFSLIHDDIMDKAPLRRGKPTVHEKWSDSVGILSGDALIIKAYEQLSLCPANVLGTLLPLFNRTALEVCEGQQYDMDFENMAVVSVDSYIAMIRLKTSVLLGCALQMGAIVAEAGFKDQQLVYEFGVNIGVAFQLQDDILDVYGDPDLFGKQIGGDILSNKKTILYTKLKELVQGHDSVILDKLLQDSIHTEPGKVEMMKDLYAQYNIKEKAIALKDKYIRAAYNKLNAIDVSVEKKQALFSLSDALTNRIR